MTSPALGILLVAHVVAAVLAYGAVGMTGAYARTCRLAVDPYGSERLGRFFAGGPNLASRVLFVVPALGFAVVFAEPAGELTRAYPWIGLGIWTISVAVATSSLWPAERTIQRLLAEGPNGAGRCALDDACRSAERAAAVMSVAFLVAAAVMIAHL